MASTIYKPSTPIKGGGAQYSINYDAPCSATYTDTNGRTWTYKGYRDNTGKCIYFNRVLASAAFDGEREVWADLKGYSSLDGDSCAIKNPDGSISTGVMKNGVCTPATKGKGWDFANNLLNLASQYVGIRQDTAQPNVTVNVPEQPKRTGTGTIIAIVAGVAVLGTIAYYVFKKK